MLQAEQWRQRLVAHLHTLGAQSRGLIRSALSPALYAHTSANIDFASLRGKCVAVLGAGASAFDNAATALEQGAREVHLLFRRAELVSVNPYRWAEFVGFLKHFGDLPDAQKWRFVSQIMRMGQLPPRDTFQRVSHYTFGSLLSLGFGGGSISGMKYSVARLCNGITRSLFLEDSEHYFEALCSFAEREL